MPWQSDVGVAVTRVWIPSLQATIDQLIQLAKRQLMLDRPLSPIRQQGTSASYVRNPKEGENRKDNPESQNQGRQKTTCLLRGSQSPSSLPKGAKKKKKRQRPKEQIQQTNTSPTKDRQSQERGSMCRAPIRERLHPDCARSDTEYTNNAERNVLRRFGENGVECTIVNGVYIPKLDLSWLDEDKPIDVVTKSPEEPKEKRRSIRSRIYSARRKRMKQRALEREGSQQNTMVEENPSIVNSEIVNDTARKETCHSTSTMLDPLSVRGTTVEVNEQRASIHSIRVDPNTDEDKKPSQGTVNSGTMDVEKIENITKDETEKSKSKSRKHDQSRNSNAVKGFKKEFLNKRSNVEYTDYSVFLADSACSTVQKHPEKKRGAWDKMEVYREISEEIKEEKKSFKQKLQGLKKYLISKKNHWTAKVSTGDGGPPQAPKKKKFELILKFSKI
ncbi:hypothetical protein LOTGIDRAFT_155825 [Lottia gigantea]|uniref:Uncharacterized protein n=1 Tax=Lottia gigantea TaxID=225164 RepID=V3ZK92_LOTGI|nr:hypothetical protein LOTGIDRAFT_155825 [Lottia gigantea]ESO82795.1 hypothetical protein LOTGIDRAFT_155825 [Lottia gigantea]